MQDSGRYTYTLALLAAVLTACLAAGRGRGQEAQPLRATFGMPQELPGMTVSTHMPLPHVPETPIGNRPLPINLPTALELAGVNPVDIALATQRLRAAGAELQRANVLWLPTLYFGIDYFRHDGRIQDVVGNVLSTNKSTFMVGGSPQLVFAVTDAIYGPLAARQIVRAREAGVQATRNDSLLAVAEAYFNVQQARGEVAGAVDTLRRTEEMVQKIEKLVGALSPAVEKNRALTELASRRMAVETAYEHWQTASAEMNRLLRLDPAGIVQPLEPPHLNIDLLDLSTPVDDYIAIGLTHRPELASQQALVQALLARVRQEKIRPWVPSVLVRGAATNPAGTLAAGYFGGGINDNLSGFGGRNSIDLQLLWEWQSLGLGNRALVKQREAENQQALLTLMRTQESVAAEVVQAHAQAKRAQNRLHQAEDGLKNALITVEKNLEGLQHTRNRAGMPELIFRPFEVVAAIQSLDQAYRNYYTAVADSNRAQFRLYRSIGHPAPCLMQEPRTPPAESHLPSSLMPAP